jgi:hypothetical protein
MHIDSDRSQFNPAPDGKPLSESTLNSALMSFSVGSPDALRKLEEGGFWLEAYRSGVKGDPMRAFQVVDRIDALMQPYRLEATREYLGSGGRQQTYRERRIWHAVVHFAHELASGYETCLQMFQSGIAGSQALAPLVPTIGARAMRALTLVLRWNLLRYAAAEPSVWSRMSALYAFAERERFVSERFKVYRDMQGDSTVRREYLRALILAVSGTENLLPASQVLAERVIASVADFFLLHRRPAEGCHFGVDLLVARPPHRVGEGVTPTRTVRFFGPGDAGMMVERLMQRTAETGTVPEELKLVGEFHPGTVHEVLQHLTRQWGANPPSRAEMRQRVLSTLNVAHGLDLVLRAVSADQGGSELDEITEAWTVEDESNGGFGAALPAREGDWLAVGMLVASKPTWPASWSVGVIRRLSTDATGRRAVGVQVLARGGIAVELTALPITENARPLLGILLPGEGQTHIGGEVTLVLPRACVSWSETYALRVRGRNYVVNPLRTADSGDDFDAVAFSIQPAEIA